MSIRILATADIHIGRQPTKLPDETLRARYSSARMWEKTVVQAAVRERVDLVALTGDIVDHKNKYFEATGPLERGLAELAKAGIPTYAVAGNHDYDVFPRLVDAIDPEYFHYIGAGGIWEEQLFESRAGERLRIHGWSFPSLYVPVSPMARYDLPTDGNLPTLGLLHADLDAPASRYGPVARADLRSRDVTMWLLGHVHAAQYQKADGGPAILYPGSPQAMDPGETGLHGPWLIEIDGPRTVTARPLGMSGVRYEPLTVDLGALATQDEFEARVNQQCRQFLGEIAGQAGPPKLLVLRLSLVGRTEVCGQVEGWSRRLLDDYSPSVDGVAARIERVDNRTRPPLDLEALSRQRDPLGVLAGVLLGLESGRADAELAALLDDAHRKMTEVYNSKTFDQIQEGDAPQRDDARAAILQQGVRLLEALRAQEPPQ